MKRTKAAKKRPLEPEPQPAQRQTRTDLALEARELWHREAGQRAAIPGVRAEEVVRRGIRTTVVRILNEAGARELGKPCGTYVTLELSELQRHAANAFRRVSQTLAAEMAALMRLSPESAVLVVGLGNEDVTPDALGPLVLRRLLVTRHLAAERETPFGSLRRVSALQPGVLGTTGMESFDVVRSVVAQTKPDAVIAVDALAARSFDRLCTTVQFSDTGITPGSGVGNRRLTLSRQTLGVPVFAVGSPTVADASALLDGADAKDADMILTPRSIDARIRQIAGIIGTSLNLALHNQLTRAQIEQLVEDSR